MENTLENKAKLFAQYWGQEVVRNTLFNFTDAIEVSSASFNIEALPYLFLELKPISSISDEDLIQLVDIPKGWDVFKIYHTTRDGYSAVKIRRLYDDNELKFNDDGYKYEMKTLSVGLSTTVDYLRSRGYALPWMGLSVEELVNIGWVKLKGENNE